MAVSMSPNEKQTLLVQHTSINDQAATRWPTARRIVFAMFILLVTTTHLLFSYTNFDSTSHSKASLKWEPCGEINQHKLECTRIDVPMDQFNKSTSDKTFSLPLVRLLATNTSATGGKSILLNPGGPGGSGAEFIWRRGEQLNKIIGEGFHLLSFDPRGVNGSIPQARCFVTKEQRAEKKFKQPWDIEFEAGDMFTGAENQARACTEVMGEHGLYINTPQTAADMNSILDAIGQEEMYYWGFSYGTTLGQTYAQMFPDRVTRLIIDGVSNLDDWYNAFVDEEDLIDTDTCFSEFVRHCFEAEDCPLNRIKDISFKTAGDLQTYINNFLDDLEEAPIPVYLGADNYGAVTRRRVVMNGVFAALYKPSPMWPVLARNLAQLLNGNATSAYQAYTDSWVAKVIQDETNEFVVQNDNWKSGAHAPEHGIKPLQNLTISLPKVSKLVTKYIGSDLYARASWDLPTTHDFHPKYHPEFPRVKTANPILVLSTTYDPVCPLISAKKAHNSFEGAGFVEQKSTGHCSVSMPSLCTAKHVQRYFYDGILPEKGATCEIDAEYFPSPGSSVVAKKHLGEEDSKLLQALQELAAIGIDDGPRF